MPGREGALTGLKSSRLYNDTYVCRGGKVRLSGLKSSRLYNDAYVCRGGEMRYVQEHVQGGLRRLSDIQIPALAVACAASGERR